MTTEDRLRTVLRAIADEVEPSPDLRARSLEPPRRRRGAVVVAAAAVVVAVALVGALLVRDGDREAEVFTDDSTESTAGWLEVPPAPIEPSTRPATVWTGRELLVWGPVTTGGPGSVGGAGYDPAMRQWRRLPDPPARLTGQASVESVRGVWTGEVALFVWFGDTEAGSGLVEYDPGDDAWTELASPPLGPRLWGEVVWSGSELYAVGGGIGDSLTEPLGLVYDPDGDEWRGLPAPPYPSWGPAGVEWAGQRLVALGGTSSATGAVDDPLVEVPGATFDPGADQWTPIAENSSGCCASTASVGRRVVAMSDTSLGVYDVVIESWTTFDLPPRVQRRQLHSLLPFGDDVIAVSDANEVSTVDLETGAWSSLTRAPLDRRDDGLVVLAGSDVVIWGGSPAGADRFELRDGMQYRLAPATSPTSSTAPDPSGDGGGAPSPSVAVVRDFLDALRDDDVDAAATHLSEYAVMMTSSRDDARDAAEVFAEEHPWLVDAEEVDLIETPSFGWTPESTADVVTAVVSVGAGEKRTLAFVVGPDEQDRLLLLRINGGDAEFEPARGAVVGPGDRIVLRTHPIEGGATAHVNGRAIDEPIVDYERMTTTIVLPEWVGDEDDIVLTYSEATPEVVAVASIWYRTEE